MFSLLQDQGYNETNITNPCSPSGYNVEIMSKDIFEKPCVKTYTNQFLQFRQFGDTYNVSF